MKKLHLLGVGFVFIFLSKLHAAEDLSAQLSAVEQTALVPNSAIPKSGLFYSAKLAGEGMDAPIYPGAVGLSAWDLGNGAWLVDDLNPVVPVRNGLLALDDSGVPPPPGAGTNGYSGTNTYVFTPTPINTNGLYLKIDSVAGGEVGLNLMNSTDTVYAIWSSTNILDGWQIETALYPSVATTNTLPFTVNTANRDALFLRASDWTGVDADGDGIPDSWIYYWFNNLSESGTNTDASGNSLYTDYYYGMDPNIINFSIQVTNNYVNTMTAPVQLNISSGVPAYVAVSVDDTNYATDASWQNYTTANLNVNLGLTPGWHEVFVGLKGPAPNATVTWVWKRLELDYAPPVLAITNPTTSVVDEPVIQIYGYCQESLAGISYDVSNAAGVMVDQPAGITGRYYDTNVRDFTACYFECLDVPLTNGVNVITLHATDVAGNVTTTNFSFTLDYTDKTNPPVAQIVWPQSGAQVSGTNFTLRGWLADPTATVTTQLLATNGGVITTNVYAAEVERNGNFWLENLPLSAGTNHFTLVITDAAGNTSVTNFSVAQSSLVLTVNPVTPDSQLWQSAIVFLVGTISDPTDAVWVNGVKGNNVGNGNWTASNVPVNHEGGTATFTVTAYAPTEQQPDGSYGN